MKERAPSSTSFWGGSHLDSAVVNGGYNQRAEQFGGIAWASTQIETLEWTGRLHAVTSCRVWRAGGIGYGGSQSLESPSFYSDIAKALLNDLDIDTDLLADACDQDFYKCHGLAAGIHFNSKD